MTIPSLPEQPIQPDEALRLLADLYARRFQYGPPSQSHPPSLVSWHASQRIRDLLFAANGQQDALTRLRELVQQVEEPHASSATEASIWKTVVGKACDLVAQVMQADGSTQVDFIHLLDKKREAE